MRSVAGVRACVEVRWRGFAQARRHEWQAERVRERGAAGNRHARDTEIEQGHI